jgi:hypothetical protein
MVTQVSENTYQRALERAVADEVVILGKGRRLADGVTVYATRSKNGAYVVAVTADGWQCECKAGQADRFCKHAAVVLQRTRQELAAKLAKPVTVQVMVAARSTSHAGSSLLRDPKPFSMLA